MLTALLAAALLAPVLPAPGSAPGSAPAAPIPRVQPDTARPDSSSSDSTSRGAHIAARIAARIAGRVTDDVLDRPLERAIVWLSGESVRRTATTGGDGAFAFPDLPAGRYLLSVQREAYDSTSIAVLAPPGREIVVDVQLARRPQLLLPVVVHAPPEPRARSEGTIASDDTEASAARTLRALDIRSHAGSMLASSLGGRVPERPPDPGGGSGHTLFVWGTEDESARVLLDGAVIGAPLHLGGLLPSVDPELIDRARIRTGGASARFDGGTGYVLELSTRQPSAGSLRMWGESNLLSDRVGGEAPLGESGSVLAGARRVRTEMLPRLSGVMRGYWYDDLLARASLRAGDHGEVHATLFGTNEALRIPRDQGSDEAAWRNRAGSLVWQSGNGVEQSAVRFSMARAATDLPLLSAFGGHLRGDVERATLAASRRWAKPRWRWGVGGEVEHARFGREARVAPGAAPAGDSTAIASTDVARTAIESSETTGAAYPPCGEALSCTHTGATTAALYGDLRHQLAEYLWLDAGLRIATTPDDRDAPLVDVLPRLALEANVAPRTSLRLAAGRYSRLAAIFSAEAGDGDAGDGVEVPGGAATPPPMLDARIARDHAVQLELSATHRWGRTLLALSTFLHKNEGDPPRTHLDHAVGIDASLSYYGEWLSLGGGYTRIARSYDVVAAGGGASFEGASSADAATHPRFGVEHLLSLDGSARVGRFSLALSGSYARGIPYTSIVLDRPAEYYSGSPSPLEASADADGAAALARSYLRLDATLSGRWCIGGRECPVRLSPYLRVINALDRRDALFYYQDGALDDARSLAALPAVLSVGVKWELARTLR